MIEVKQNVTINDVNQAFLASSNKGRKARIIWAIIFSVLLTVFIIVGIHMGAFTGNLGPLLFAVLPLLIIATIYTNFFHYKVRHKLETKKIDPKIDSYIETEFHETHISVKKSYLNKVFRVEYDKLASVEYLQTACLLIFYIRGDSGDYLYLFLKDLPSDKVKSVVDSLPFEIKNSAILESDFNIKIEKKSLIKSNIEPQPTDKS